MRLLDELFAAGWGRVRQGMKAADDAGAVRGGRRNRRASRVGRQAQFEALEQRKMLAVLISQYVETNSGTTPKGIELWNPTASAEGLLNDVAAMHRLELGAHKC